MAANREDFEAMPQAACPMSVGEVDLFAPGAQEHWYDSYKLLQAEEPVLRLPGQGYEPGADAFVLTKYEDIRRVVRDPDLFPTRQGPGSSGTSKIHDEIFEDEGFGDVVTARERLRPDIDSHKAHREQLTEPWVGASGALQHRDMITAHANRLIDNWIDKGEVEFVTEFAAPLPQAVISTILGFPLEDMPMTKKWEEAQVRRFVYGFGPKSQMEDPDEEDNAKALVAFNRYIQEQIDEKRRNPRDDMITFLTQVEFQGKPLGDGDIISVVSGMHIGGNETTQYALTSEAMLLAQHPEIVEELRADRSKVRFFVEEALRLYAPTQGLSGRMVARDTEIHGVSIPAGSLLHLRWAAANRDPDLCEAPDELRLDRKNPGKHLTFSIRPRGCPGAGLSRLEQNIAVDVLLDRIDEIKLATDGNDFRHQPGIMLGLYELHLAFTKAREPVAAG